jgi:hypothetical protein
MMMTIPLANQAKVGVVRAAKDLADGVEAVWEVAVMIADTDHFVPGVTTVP